jgi:hypothetical protein
LLAHQRLPAEQVAHLPPIVAQDTAPVPRGPAREPAHVQLPLAPDQLLAVPNLARPSPALPGFLAPPNVARVQLSLAPARVLAVPDSLAAERTPIPPAAAEPVAVGIAPPAARNRAARR